MEDLTIHKVKDQYKHLINIYRMHSLVQRIIKKTSLISMRQSAIFCNTITQKKITTRHTPLDIISAANNENLIQEAIENRKISRKKAKENRKIFEIDEVVRISNFLRIKFWENVCRCCKSDKNKEGSLEIIIIKK